MRYDSGPESLQEVLRGGAVADAGYRGWVGIEYEGMSERDGIVACKALLERHQH